MEVHGANIDIQYITDAYAVAEYVSNYCTKLEGGSTALLKNINETALAEGEAAKETLKKLSKALDRGREVGIQECVYRILGLPMSKFSEVVRFINSNHPDRRDGLLKQNFDDLPAGEPLFHNSIHDYYMSRPHNSPGCETDWENMTLAEFVANYNVVQKLSKNPRNETATLLNKKGYVVKRSKQCVIRYFLHYENDQEYHRGLCVLFLPFRDEMRDIHGQNVLELYEVNKDQIDNVRGQFEKHQEMVNVIKEHEKNQEKPPEDLDDDEEEEKFEDEETTNPSDVEQFIKETKAAAKKKLSNSYPAETVSDDKYLEMINSLNSEQRKIFNDIVERFNDMTDSDPFYLYIGGEAGVGKSYLLKLLKHAAERIPKQSGKELDKPQSITIAPTGVAAYLIGGSTIESALGMHPGRKSSVTVGAQSRNSHLRFVFEDLKVIFLDEVSMCGSNVLNKINVRLQEIRGNNLFMGGVSVICLGDFGQLPPVKDQMIWNQSMVDGRIELAPNLWDVNFRIYFLTEKMRSTDEEYSVICDKVRRGDKSEEVQKYLQSRVIDPDVNPCPHEDNLKLYQEGKICIVVSSNKHRKKINLEKLHSLIPDKPSVTVWSSDQSTNIKNPPKLPSNVPHTKTGQLENEIIFKEGAPVMITSNSQVPKYKKNGIVNGVRGYVDSFQYSAEDPSSPEYIWVRFNDNKTGQLLRFENRHLLQHHKPNDELAVPIARQKKSFSFKGNTKYLRSQFPLTLCFAVTGHKVIITSIFFYCFFIQIISEPRTNPGGSDC